MPTWIPQGTDPIDPTIPVFETDIVPSVGIQLGDSWQSLRSVVGQPVETAASAGFSRTSNQSKAPADVSCLTTVWMIEN